MYKIKKGPLGRFFAPTPNTKAPESLTQGLFILMAERVGFEPTYGLTHNSISSRARYGRTSLPLRSFFTSAHADVEWVYKQTRRGLQEVCLF